ncbi:hypothetical protein GQ600_14952 [Phytophthora cactorum]|nr:hypothetical protein GQ600_14952 [Phytophthora cactorum]
MATQAGLRTDDTICPPGSFCVAAFSIFVLKARTEPLPVLRLTPAPGNAKTDISVHEAQYQQSNRPAQPDLTHEMASSVRLALLATGVTLRLQIPSNTPAVLTTRTVRLDPHQLNLCLMVTLLWDNDSIHTRRRRCAYSEMLLTFHNVLQELQG